MERTPHTKFRTGLFIIITGALYNCGSSKSASSEDYGYELEVNGCNTGKHSFKSKAAYCEGLKDGKLR